MGPEPQPLHGSCVYAVVEELGTGEEGLTCNIGDLFIYLFMFLPCELIGGGWGAWHGQHVWSAGNLSEGWKHQAKWQTNHKSGLWLATRYLILVGLMLGESKYQSPPICVPICTYHVPIVLGTSKPRTFVGFVMEDEVCVSYCKSPASRFAMTNLRRASTCPYKETLKSHITLLFIWTWIMECDSILI